MSEITVANTNSSYQKSSESTIFDDRAYGLVQKIRGELETYGLDSGEVSIEVETNNSEDSLEITYMVETLEWYEEDGELGLGKEPVSFSNSYSIDSNVEVLEGEIADILEDNFGSTAIRADGEVIQESLSPDYNAF